MAGCKLGIGIYLEIKLITTFPNPDLLQTHCWASDSLQVFFHHIFHGSISAVTSRLSIAQTRPDGELLTLALTWSFPPESRAESLGSDGTRAGCAENSKVRIFAWRGICVGSRLVPGMAFCGKRCGELFDKRHDTWCNRVILIPSGALLLFITSPKMVDNDHGWLSLFALHSLF